MGKVNGDGGNEPVDNFTPPQQDFPRGNGPEDNMGEDDMTGGPENDMEDPRQEHEPPHRYGKDDFNDDEEDMEDEDDFDYVGDDDDEEEDDEGDMDNEEDIDDEDEMREDEDPKKYIQRLSGKLSQALNSYQSERDEPDSDIAKYVAGMVVSASIKGMDKDDAEDVIKKIKKGAKDKKHTKIKKHKKHNEDSEDTEITDESLDRVLEGILQDMTDSDNENNLKKTVFSRKPYSSPSFS